MAPTTGHRSSETHFAYPDDRGSFATAIERCFGMAKCRNLGSLTMCPSFHATREERRLDPRPLSPAVRDAQGRSGHRRVARRRGQGVARPVPVVQGLHRRLPRFRSTSRPTRRSSSRTTTPSAGGRCTTTRSAFMPWWGQVAARAPRTVNALQPFRAGRRTCEADNRHGRGARDPEVRSPDIPQLVRGPEQRDGEHPTRRERRPAPGRAVARYVRRPVRPRHRQGRGRRA